MLKKRRSQLILNLQNKKTDPENDENAIDFRSSDIQKKKMKKLLRLTSLRACKSNLMKKVSQKNNLNIV